MYLNTLKTKWDNWAKLFKNRAEIQPLPYSKTDVEYLSSPIVDIMVKTEGKSVNEALADICREYDCIELVGFFCTNHDFEAREIAIICCFAKSKEIREYLSAKYKFGDEIIIIAKNWNVVRINDGWINYLI